MEKNEKNKIRELILEILATKWNRNKYNDFRVKDPCAFCYYANKMAQENGAFTIFHNKAWIREMICFCCLEQKLCEQISEITKNYKENTLIRKLKRFDYRKVINLLANRLID